MAISNLHKMSEEERKIALGIEEVEEEKVEEKPKKEKKK